MNFSLLHNELHALDLQFLSDQIKQAEAEIYSRETLWQFVANKIRSYSFEKQAAIYNAIYPNALDQPETAPTYIPTKSIIDNSNLMAFMQTHQFEDYKKFHAWTFKEYKKFWAASIEHLGIRFQKKYTKIVNLEAGITAPKWLPEARLNIASSCFSADPKKPALRYKDFDNQIHDMSYAELLNLSNRVANSLLKQQIKKGDAIAIIMPMHPLAVAIYLGIIKMGGVVVSIADSFTAEEIALRLKISHAKLVFSQDYNLWDGKTLKIYEKIQQSMQALDTPVQSIVLSYKKMLGTQLQAKDLSWEEFLVSDTNFADVACDPMDAINVLFSSGTTGTPKAIVWNHTTPIKSAVDAFFHHDIKPEDVFCWPTSLGWMMGPWLIFATLINRGTIGLYMEAPKNKAFGDFIAESRVTILGVIPTLVAFWKATKCMETCDWSTLKLFTSTGECSNPKDMFYLTALIGYKPIIEYCGGTEIGGAYITSTVIEKNYPSLFTTPTVGLDFTILDEEQHEASIGEVALIPPSMGLSTTLMNGDHYQTYYANMPHLTEEKILRRHGDQIKRFENGLYSILGRVDDTMNLGGIKISAAEIERCLIGIKNITELAAVSYQATIPGPTLLVIFVVAQVAIDKTTVMKEMQTRINQHLNPLFKIYDVVVKDALPKTASNKIMRRLLRKDLGM